MAGPRDDFGRFIPTECPHCLGTLKYEGLGHWRCDGLADPNDVNKELDACTFSHDDGEPYVGALDPRTPEYGVAA